MSKVCITLRKRQYSISMHTDYDFDRPILYKLLLGYASSYRAPALYISEHLLALGNRIERRYTVKSVGFT